MEDFLQTMSKQRTARTRRNSSRTSRGSCFCFFFDTIWPLALVCDACEELLMMDPRPSSVLCVCKDKGSTALACNAHRQGEHQKQWMQVLSMVVAFESCMCYLQAVSLVGRTNQMPSASGFTGVRDGPNGRKTVENRRGSYSFFLLGKTNTDPRIRFF